MQHILPWDSFPLKAYDKLRYADTDRQGHVNNAVFATFLETGRVEMLYQNEGRLIGHGNSYVIASLQLDLVAEIKWPGTVEIGTAVSKVGNSSIKLYQQLFQNGVVVAKATSVLVQVNSFGKSEPLSDAAKSILEAYFHPNM